MVLLKDRVKKSEDKIDAIFAILDDHKTIKIEEEKQKAIYDALEKAKLSVDQKRIKSKDKLLYLLWIPIILLIVSAIISWISKFYGEIGRAHV